MVLHVDDLVPDQGLQKDANQAHKAILHVFVLYVPRTDGDEGPEAPKTDSSFSKWMYPVSRLRKSKMEAGTKRKVLKVDKMCWKLGVDSVEASFLRHT